MRIDLRDSDAITVEEGEFLYGLVRSIKPEICVETGTHKGFSASCISDALEANQKGHLDTCDTVNFEVEGLDLPRTTFSLCRGDQLEVDKIDFLFLDGTHGKEDVLAEMKHFTPKLNRGAIVVFHDCDMVPNNGVNDAIYQLGLKTVLIPTQNRLRIYQHVNNYKVSAIVPTLGQRPEMLAETLASLRAQTVPVEIIVVDYPDDSPGNQARRLNWGVKHSTGTHYFFIGDDDIVLPTFVEQIMNEFDGYDIVSSGFQNFGDDDGTHYPGPYPLAATIVSREMYDKTIGYDENAGIGCDGDFYFQCFDLGAKWNQVHTVLYKSRVHSNQYSKKNGTVDWDHFRRHVQEKYKGRRP